MDLLRLVGGGGLPRADGPDGLVGDDDVLGLLRGEPAHPLLDVLADDVLGGPPLALIELLADAEDGGEAPGEDGGDLLADPLVRLAQDVPALGVAAEDVGAPGVLEHGDADLAGEGALGLPVAVLRAEPDWAVLDLVPHVEEVGERRADGDVHLGQVKEVALDARSEGGGLLEAPVHLPIADDDGPTHPRPLAASR